MASYVNGTIVADLTHAISISSLPNNCCKSYIKTLIRSEFLRR